MNHLVRIGRRYSSLSAGNRMKVIGCLFDGGSRSRSRSSYLKIPTTADTWRQQHHHLCNWSCSVSDQTLQEYPKTSIYKFKEEEKGVSEFDPECAKNGMLVDTQEEDQGEVIDIKEGDIVNLTHLLFTQHRDYLLKNNGQKVKAEQLEQKSILLYFVPVYLDRNCLHEKEWTTHLIDIYNDLLPNNDFEVIFVAVDDLCSESFLGSQRELQKKFDSIFARMPWTAIPFSDIASRKHLARKLGVLGGKFFCGVQGGKLLLTSSVSLDSKGMVLKRNGGYYFGEYGAPGYPFTDERMEFLDSEDDAVAKKPSLESLLISPERDYVISNKGDRVPIHSLKDKVVALYFYEDVVLTDYDYRWVMLTEQLQTAYKELKENKEKFEVVFLYLYDTRGTLHCTSEESFWNTFKTMPWLALPFKDSSLKKLKRIFGYPEDLDGPERAPRLVIIGPDGDFVDPCGDDIMDEFGTFAYPFTRKRVAKLETNMTMELKLEMLWDPNTVFKIKKSGLQIPVSQLAGKRLLLYFDMREYDLSFHWKELLKLKDLYLKMKGTNDEFEVLYIKDSSSTKKPDVQRKKPDYGELPWLVHYYEEGYSLPKELDCSFFNFNCYRGRSRCRHSLLVAFDCDGSIVRKTFDPSFNDSEFPFYAGGLEKEYLDQLNSRFDWYYWDYAPMKHPIIYRNG